MAQHAESAVNRYRDAQSGGPKFIFVTPDYYEDRPKACMNGWGTTFLTVTPDGSALPCHSAKILPLTFPNVKNSSLRDIWHEDFSFNHFRGDNWMQSPCKGCNEKSKDFGGCRCQAYMLTGDMYKTDPVCSKSPDHHMMKSITDKAGSKASTALKYRYVERGIDIAVVDS